MRDKDQGSIEISGVEILYAAVQDFLSKIEVRPRSECLWWTGAKDRKGYGQFWAPGFSGKTTAKAHRFAYWVIRGPFFPEEEIDHLCLNVACVNPYHMEVVTKTVNTARGNRSRARGRGPR